MERWERNLKRETEVMKQKERRTVLRKETRRGEER